MSGHTYIHTYIHTHRTTTVTVAAHARRGLITIIIVRATPIKWRKALGEECGSQHAECLNCM